MSKSDRVRSTPRPQYSHGSTVRTYYNEGKVLTDEMIVEARKILSLAVEFDATYVAFDQDEKREGPVKIVVEIDAQTNCKVEAKMGWRL